MSGIDAVFSVILLAAFPSVAHTDEPWREEVDLELVLAVDASGSISLELGRTQRLGFAAAFRDPDLQHALLSGPLGTVVVVYFEWAGSGYQRLVVPWTLLSTKGEITAFAERLEESEQYAGGGGTSISGAMQFSKYLLASNSYEGLRNVVDIAANGKNSEGIPLAVALRELRASGAIVNVLILPDSALADEGPYARLFRPDDEPLDAYFRNHVAGGPGSFVMAVDPETGFADAILRKLVLEVAWSTEQVSHWSQCSTFNGSTVQVPERVHQ